MRFVFVIEDDPKFMTEMTEALLAIDPTLQVRQFPDLALFVEWLKLLMSEGIASIKKVGLLPEGFKFDPISDSDEPVLQLIISKVECLGPGQINLIRKTRDLFVRHHVCTAADPTAFVLTGFEDPNFHVEELRDRIISNILLKPFDKLILQQHLNFALDGRHVPSKYAVAPYRTSAIIEVLKLVQMESMSQVGFVTRSNRMLPAQAVSKYYSRIFSSDRHRSLIAKLTSCELDPNDPNNYISSFAFFGADPTQIANLRRRVSEDKKKTISPVSLLKGDKKSCRIIFIEERPDVVQTLGLTFKRKVSGAEILYFQSLREFLLELDPRMEGTTPGMKAFSGAGTTELTLDPKGRILKVEAAPIHFLTQVLNPGFIVIPLIRESEQEKFKAWLAKPVDPFLSIWVQNDKSFVVKLTPLPGGFTRVEEAGSLEKEEFARKNSRLSDGWDFLFVSDRFAGQDRAELWAEILKRAKATETKRGNRLFVIASREYTDEEERRLAAVFDDLFFLPLERIYILQKMILYCPSIEILEDPIETRWIQQKEMIKSARPAPIEEMSEASIVMKYDRQVSLGSFREFVLWQPYEIGAPEINATCNLCEETSSKGEYRLHFVFFGMYDLLLKAIRKWIIENYIQSKDQGGS